MRTIRNLINQEKKVYIILHNKEMQYRFMSDAAREGITFGDGVKTTERDVDDILMQDVPDKYFLSEAAMRKILKNSSLDHKDNESTKQTE